MRMLRRVVWHTAVSMAVVLVLSSCTGQPAPGPTPVPGDGAGASSEGVAVTPSTGLVDGQAVTVRGWGYSPNAPVGLIQCRAPAEGYEDCTSKTAHSFSTDPGGGYQITYDVTRILRFGNGREHDCAVPDSCFLVSVYPHGFYGRAVAPLQFTQGPAVSAWPNVALTDQQQIQVKGYGYGPNAPLGIVQCPRANPSIDRCDGRTAASFSVDASGSYTRQMTVYKVIRDAHGVETDCAVPGSCVVASVYIHGFQGLATDDLRFLP